MTYFAPLDIDGCQACAHVRPIPQYKLPEPLCPSTFDESWTGNRPILLFFTYIGIAFMTAHMCKIALRSCCAHYGDRSDAKQGLNHSFFFGGVALSSPMPTECVVSSCQHSRHQRMSLLCTSVLCTNPCP